MSLQLAYNAMTAPKAIRCDRVKVGEVTIANAATGPEGENLGAFAKQTIQTALN